MSDYIKREDAEQAILDCPISGLLDLINFQTAITNIDTISSADVVEVRHGKWSHNYVKDGMEYNDWFNLHCSVCGEMQREAWGKWNYCPYCGAKMDGEEQEHE